VRRPERTARCHAGRVRHSTTPGRGRATRRRGSAEALTGPGSAPPDRS